MSSDQADRLLQVAISAARAGGEMALARRNDPGYLRWKGPRDLQAGASLDIQRRIVEVIQAEFPGDALLLEETTDEQHADSASSGSGDPAERLWIVDPICGSFNFNQGIPLFAVCVGCRAGGRDEIGVVYDPCNDELFQARFGGGAYLNGQPIFVDQMSEGEDAYKRAMVGTDLPGSLEDRKRALFVNRSLGNDVSQLWILGSPALGLCYVAAGRLNAYFSLDLELWDVAAASVILKEAGGTLTDITGGPWLFSEGGQVASNGVIHGGMLRGIKPALDILATRQGREV
ncbi:MAG TPA: inositol monophosphatase family protein [Candidatus Limnocylindria bacterium]|nr:inositol monophosphatase family protein [Candidatus Limnocylindria bacterium]